VGPVHTHDHDPRCFVVDTEPTAGQFKGKGSYVYVLQEFSNRGGSTPRRTPGGSQVEPKF